MGGYLLSSNYLTPRSASTLDKLPMPFHDPLFPVPNPEITNALSSSGVEVSTKHLWDENGASTHPRMSFFSWAMQHGIWLDYMTGKPGLSDVLRSRLDLPGDVDEDGDAAHLSGINADDLGIPPDVLDLFPELYLTPAFPPTILIHGVEDSAVFANESRRTARQLRSLNVNVLHIEVGEKGGSVNSEHDFDSASGWRGEEEHELWERMRMGEVLEFLRAHI